METKTTPKKNCVECGKAIPLGEDLIGLQLGVMGPRGVIPLDEMMLLCSEECLDTHKLSGEGASASVPFRAKRRIP